MSLWEVRYRKGIASDTIDSDLEEVFVELIPGTTVFRKCAYVEDFRGLSLSSVFMSSEI